MMDMIPKRASRRQWIDHGKALTNMASSIARGDCSDASIMSPMGIRVTFRSLDEFRRYVEWVSKKAGRVFRCL